MCLDNIYWALNSNNHANEHQWKGLALVVAMWSHPGSICRSNVQHDICSSTSRSLPAEHSCHQTCHCRCLRYWTACRYETCRTCHWGHHQTESHRKHLQHHRQRRIRMLDGTCRPLIQLWTCCSRHTWRKATQRINVGLWWHLQSHFLLLQRVMFAQWVHLLSSYIICYLLCVWVCTYLFLPSQSTSSILSTVGRVVLTVSRWIFSLPSQNSVVSSGER